MTRRLALITGASAGIGAALAETYASRGFNVFLIARRLERLEALAARIETRYGVNAFTHACDLAHADAASLLTTHLKERLFHVDVLINNAGFGLPGAYAETSWRAQADFLQLMLTTPLELTHGLLPAMQANRWGRIINIASLAGITPGGNGHTLYGATKAALIKFSQSLNAENEHCGVHATAICPGFTYSEFHDVNGTRKKADQLPGFMWQTSAAVAEAAYDASERNHAVFVPGRLNKAIAALAKALPDNLALKIMKRKSADYYNRE